MTIHTCFFWGSLGGVFLELCHWYSIRTKPKFPTYLRRFTYWLPTIFMILFGGLFAVLLLIAGNRVMSEISALAIGFMAPSFQNKLKNFLPKKAVLGIPGPTAGLRDFYDW
jgi:hypothetical protein